MTSRTLNEFSVKFKGQGKVTESPGTLVQKLLELKKYPSSDKKETCDVTLAS